MRFFLPITLFALCLAAGLQAANAQGPGSEEVDMGLTIVSGGTTATAAETVYLGPGTYQIDGNNNAGPISVNLELQNAAGMIVTASSATLSGYQSDRFVVTNGTGHLVHANYTGPFIFPIGITAGDYTPAAVNSSTANAFHVMVQNYASSSSLEAGSNGINRTWNIYADNAGSSATVDLQHNLSTNQASYNNTSAFITRYGPAAPNNSGTLSSQSLWQSNSPGPGSTTGTLTTTTATTGASELTLTYTGFATTAADPIAFFSKSSDILNPLPLQLLSFPPNRCLSYAHP